VLESNEKVEVGKILCLGSNYAKHIDEMGSAKPDVPVIFIKPATAMLKNGGTIQIPPFSTNAHHEVELVIVIGKEGKNISKEEVNDYILGYALGLDITLRDVQSEAKKKGRPWSVAKGFDTSAPLTDIIPKNKVPTPHDLGLKLWVNNELRQDGYTKDMIFKIDEIVSYLSTVYTLERGDLIYTGTPEGVAQLHPGDRVTAEMGKLVKLNVTVA
ncbi:MAG: fumarylacetoacetate hydrolase family protein, partial [bacterium]|nr:fumarylacetoacetate hydrolase family protein [bacterium]